MRNNNLNNKENNYEKITDYNAPSLDNRHPT